MSEKDFEITLKKWLKHKMVLANKSKYYAAGIVKARVMKVGDVFHHFITNRLPFTAHQLSALVLKYEDMLWGIVPSENNPAYMQSVEALKEIVEYSKKLLNQ